MCLRRKKIKETKPDRQTDRKKERKKERIKETGKPEKKISTCTEMTDGQMAVTGK